MVVGTGKIKFRLFNTDSLKGKRKIVKSLIQRIRNNFNISVAETDFNNSHEWLELGFSITGNDSRVVNSKLDKVINFSDKLSLAVIVDTQIEIIHV